jgi:hypothetical protein
MVLSSGVTPAARSSERIHKGRSGEKASVFRGKHAETNLAHGLNVFKF